RSKPLIVSCRGESFRAEIEAVVLTPDELKEEQRRPEAVRCHPDVQDAGVANFDRSKQGIARRISWRRLLLVFGQERAPDRSVVLHRRSDLLAGGGITEPQGFVIRP